MASIGGVVRGWDNVAVDFIVRRFPEDANGIKDPLSSTGRRLERSMGRFSRPDCWLLWPFLFAFFLRPHWVNRDLYIFSLEKVSNFGSK